MSDNNPKRARALLDNKAPLEYLPGATLEGVARVLKHGADKYGKFNWRVEPITASTYVGAFRRHLEAWIDGEDYDPDSGELHTDHIMANCIIIRDAKRFDTFIDDRNESEVLGRDQSDNSEHDDMVDALAMADEERIYERSTN